MPDIQTTCPEAAYLTKPNIVFPGSAAQADVAEAVARAELTQVLGVTVTGGTIER